MDRGLPRLPLYRIASQNCNKQLIIEVVNQGVFVVRTAYEILNDPRLINGFSPAEASVIGYIAGSQEVKNSKLLFTSTDKFERIIIFNCQKNNKASIDPNLFQSLFS